MGNIYGGNSRVGIGTSTPTKTPADISSSGDLFLQSNNL